MRTPRLTLAGLGLFVLTSACSMDENPQELVNKLRAIGVVATPSIAEPSTSATPRAVQLNFVALVPLEQEVTAEPFEDAQSIYALPAPLQIVDGSASYDDENNAFRVFQIRATVPVPRDDVTTIPDTGLRLRYGLALSSGAESEDVVGDIIVLKSGTEDLRFAGQTLTLAIAAPTEDGTVASGVEVPVTATLSKSIDEPVKIGWFVSGGSVKNRRAIDTKWKTPAPGNHTIVVTARGTRSRTFAYQIMNVSVR